MTEQQPELSYEEARAELVEVVQRLEAGGTTLEESLALWERGEELAGICQDCLDGARARLQQALDDPDTAASDDEDDGESTGEGNGSPPF